MKLILITNDQMIHWSDKADIDNKWSSDLMKLILITNDLVV